MQIELAKTVAAKPADAFAIVANIADRPLRDELEQDLSDLATAISRRGTVDFARDRAPG